MDNSANKLTSKNYYYTFSKSEGYKRISAKSFLRKNICGPSEKLILHTGHDVIRKIGGI